MKQRYSLEYFLNKAIRIIDNVSDIYKICHNEKSVTKYIIPVYNIDNLSINIY